MTKFKIAAIGDSITYGYPYTPAESWLYLAAKRLTIKYSNMGINGDTTEGMLSRFFEVLDYKPTHVIIMGGTNDAYRGAMPQAVMSNIAAMTEVALANNIRPIIGLPIPCSDLAEEKLLAKYREAIRRYTIANHIALLDFYHTLTECNLEMQNRLYCDSVHPSVLGYKVMADTAYKFLLNLYIADRAHDFYWDQEDSCIITTLKILSEVFSEKLDSELYAAAYGLNAGRHCSQCGLIEGALLFIGVYAKREGATKESITALCHEYAADFESEFGSVLCKELRPEGFSPQNPPHLCENITQRAVLFAATFLDAQFGLKVSE